VLTFCLCISLLTRMVVWDLGQLQVPWQRSAGATIFRNASFEFYLGFGVFIGYVDYISKTQRLFWTAIQYVPKSIAQIPVPVPTSSTLCNTWSFGIGAVNSFPLKVNKNKWCCKSRCSSEAYHDEILALSYPGDHFLPARCQ
jgi:hypothetical protein